MNIGLILKLIKKRSDIFKLTVTLTGSTYGTASATSTEILAAIDNYKLPVLFLNDGVDTYVYYFIGYALGLPVFKNIDTEVALKINSSGEVTEVSYS